MSTSPTLDFVIEELEKRSGTWPDLAAATGVPYHTLTKIAYGTIKDPGITKVEALAIYFRENPIEPTQPTSEVA